MYGVIGINFVDHFLNQGAPAEHKSVETPIGHESKVMIRNQMVDLFCLQETKIQSMFEGVVRSLGSGRFLD